MTQDTRNNAPGGPDLDRQLEAMLEQLEIERAPARLRRRLRRIPRDERRRERPSWGWQPPRWALAPALAAVPLLVIGLVLMQPRQPSEAEVDQARQDLALAFAYLDKVGNRTGATIHTVLDRELGEGVKDNLSRHIPFTEQSRKENST
ncbi:MAG: hypothetical protein HKP16_04125 [Xanthomonadales bacterium]|nr:hypothetical protein [Xanthomonadales bacterium]